MIKKLKTRLITKIFTFFKRQIETETENQRYKNFLNNATIHSSVKILPNAEISNMRQRQDLINIGKDSVIQGQLLILAHGGKISIGESSYIGIGTRIWSSASINIGDRVLISHNVNIHDTDSHSIDANQRSQHFLFLLFADSSVPFIFLISQK